MTLAPATQYLLDPVLRLVGVPPGYKIIIFDIIILFCLLLLVLTSNKNGIIKEFLNITKWWIPWLLYLAYSSDFTGLGLWKFEMYIGRLVIPVYAILILYILDSELFESIFYKVLITLVIVLVPSIYFLEFSARDFDRNIWLSRLIGVVVIYMIIKSKGDISSIKKFVFIGFLVVIMISIGSRGPVLSVFITILVFYTFKNRQNIMALGLAVFVSISAVVIVQNISSVSDKATSFLSHGKAKSLSSVKNDRFGVYPPTIKLMLREPVFGLGLAQWWPTFAKMNYYTEYREYYYPHNFVLEIGSELGLVGLFLFVLLFAPHKRLFSLSNEYNIFILLGLLYASTSSDITQNSAPMIFNLLSIAYYRRNSIANTKVDK